MTTHTLTRYNDCFEALCNPYLVQSMYDAGGVVMDRVLLTLHGEAHKTRRHLALRVFRRDFARHYEREVFPRALRDALAPCIRAGAADAARFGHAVTMNLTADFAGIDRPRRDASRLGQCMVSVSCAADRARLAANTSERPHRCLRTAAFHVAPG